MEEALEDLNRVIELSSNDKVAIQDRECLNSLATCSLVGKEEGTTVDRSTFQKAS
jgi:hypothetical protein